MASSGAVRRAWTLSAISTATRDHTIQRNLMTCLMMAVIMPRVCYDPFSLCSASMKKLPKVTTCSPGFRPARTCA